MMGSKLLTFSSSSKPIDTQSCSKFFITIFFNWLQIFAPKLITIFSSRYHKFALNFLITVFNWHKIAPKNLSPIFDWLQNLLQKIVTIFNWHQNLSQPSTDTKICSKHFFNHNLLQLKPKLLQNFVATSLLKTISNPSCSSVPKPSSTTSTQQQHPAIHPHQTTHKKQKFTQNRRQTQEQNFTDLA